VEVANGVGLKEHPSFPVSTNLLEGIPIAEVIEILFIESQPGITSAARDGRPDPRI